MARILFFTEDVVGAAMAGPGIRCWELAQALSAEHEVKIYSIHDSSQGPLSQAIAQSDIVITQVINHSMALAAAQSGARFIYDAYDPLPVENLEVFKFHGDAWRDFRQARIMDTCLFALSVADGIICANERQRDLWQGLLLATDKITPRFYDQDSTLEQLFQIVPFGFSNQPFVADPEPVYRKYGFTAKDRILLWGGGVWNWFDPLTLLQAMERLKITRPDIKLLFMGVRHPNKNVGEMKMTSDTIEYAKKAALLDKTVFFNFGWTPYQERVAYLSAAAAGLSLHQHHLETRYSFRTRILDYLWADLPVIATEGDCFAELIQSRQLGRVVPYQDVGVLERAIVQIVDDQEFRRNVVANIQVAKEPFRWDRVAQPLKRMVQTILARKRSYTKIALYKKIVSSYCKARRPSMVLKWLKAKREKA